MDESGSGVAVDPRGKPGNTVLNIGTIEVTMSCICVGIGKAVRSPSIWASEVGTAGASPG